MIFSKISCIIVKAFCVSCIYNSLIRILMNPLVFLNFYLFILQKIDDLIGENLCSFPVPNYRDVERWPVLYSTPVTVVYINSAP